MIVRKSFYDLSHDPVLVNLHLSRAVKTDPCIIINSLDHLYFLEFHDHEDIMVVREISTPFVYSAMPKFQMVSSCNGLLCIRDSLCCDSLYVFNPFTKDYLKVPCSLATIYAPQVALGFGFHPVTKEYKLIKIIDSNSPNYTDCISNVEVFTLGSNRSWTSIGEIPYNIHPSPQGIMLNGKMHWLARLGKYDEPRVRHIVSFDLADEVFGKVPKVDFDVKEKTVNCQLAVFGGCLALALTLPHYKEFEIWVMKEYNVKVSWKKEFRIGAYMPNPNNVTQQHVQPLVKVLCVLKNGKLLLLYKGPEYRNGNLVLYDSQSGVFRTLKFEGISKFYQTIVHVGCLNWIDIFSKN